MPKYTTETPDTVSEFGHMVEFRVKPDPEWSLGREQYVTRMRERVLRNVLLVSNGLTVVLTPC